MHTHSPDHSSIGTPSGGGRPRCPRTACTLAVSGSLSLPSPGCFSPFPRGTRPLSVVAGTLPWRVVSPASDGLPRAPPYSRAIAPVPPDFGYGPLTRSGGAFQSPSPHLWAPGGPPAGVPRWSLNPCHTSAAAHMHVPGFGIIRVRSPLLAESIPLPRGTKMFQFPRFPPHGL